MTSFRRSRSNYPLFEEPMFSRTTEYAMRAVVYLAAQGSEARTIGQIAEATRLHADYLSKVMQNLRKQGLVQSQRGLHGGFSLRVPTVELTVYDVVQAVDPIRRIEK